MVSRYKTCAWRLGDSLRVETAGFGIKVSIIEPGAIQTEFSDVMTGPMLELSKGGPYEDIAKGVDSGNSKYYTNAPSNSPQVIANVISKAINAKNPKTRYAAGKLAKMTLFMRRWLNDKAFDKAVMNMLK